MGSKNMTSRETYIDELQAQLDEWMAEIDVLKTDAQRLGKEVQADFLKRIDDLEDKCRQAKDRIDQIRASENASWEKLKAGAEEMWSGIKQLFRDTKMEFDKGLNDES